MVHIAIHDSMERDTSEAVDIQHKDMEVAFVDTLKIDETDYLFDLFVISSFSKIRLKANFK